MIINIGAENAKSSKTSRLLEKRLCVIILYIIL